jgi:exo-1,4-beta-D-glucosaminidase
MMLNRDSTGYANEMRLFKNSNINLVRIWGGGITPEDVFWDLADRFGLLVWSDFWVTGDTHGEFKGSTAYPLEGKIFLNNVRSTIYRIRNHASLLVWTGGNEGHVRKELYDAMRDSIIVLDGTRPFIPCSSGFAKLPEGSKSSWPDGLAPGVYSGGPYAWRSSKEYYRLSENAKDWVFKDETGLPSQPPYNSLQKIIPNLVWDSSLPFPLNHSWGYHDAATGNGKYDKYYETMVKLYGNPVSMEDFSNKMQLMNATGYQGIFEAAGHKLNDIGGVMLWKLNAAFPSVIWQVFDWYLQPNAGYYFMQNACEAIHIQLNPLNNEVTVLNRSYHPIENLSAEALVYDLNSGKLYEKKVSITLNSTEVKELFSLSDAIQSNKGVSFVDLNLRNKKGEIVSHNFYWLSPDDNFLSLNGMTKTRVESSVISKIIQNQEVKWILKFENKSDKVAFFIHPQIWINEEEILPAFWSANYFSLAPGETMNASVTVPAIKMNNLGVELRIEGWNMDLIKLPL